MRPVVPDDEVRDYCRAAAAEGTALTETFYRLKARRVNISWARLRRLWLEEGGEIQEKHSIYAPGTEPTRGH